MAIHFDHYYKGFTAPFGGEVTRDDVRDVWTTFVVPSQSDDAPPQSVETRVLMAILRAAYAALPPTENEPDDVDGMP